MDRRIPPETPVPLPSVLREAVELKIKQVAQKEAFDSALQRADQRRNMGAQERVVSAEKNKLHAFNEPTSIENTNPHVGSHGKSDSSVFKKTLNELEQLETKQAGSAADVVNVDVNTIETYATPASINATGGAARRLSEETLLALIKRFNLNQVSLDETIQLELVNDPSGVLAIKLTRDQNNGWTVDLSLDPSVSISINPSMIDTGSNSTETNISQTIVQQLRDAGIQINAVSINSAQHCAFTGVG